MNQLLISTMLNLIHYDNAPNVIDSGDLAKGDAHYNGITWNHDYLFVSAAQNTKYGYWIFDKQFNKLEFNDELDLHETHQILWYNHRLHFVNTGLNRIEWRGGYKAFNESTCDIDHLNGIWADGNHFYVSEFRHQSEQPSVVRICDLDLNLLDTVEIGLPIHNIYVENGKLHNLVSRNAGIIITDLESRQQDFVDLFELQGMLLRGLCRTESNWYIGASRWETQRDKRHVGDGVILILDNDFTPVDKIIMPDVGPVCDIRVIDELDLAHNGISY